MLRPIFRLSTRNTTQSLFRAGQQHQRRNIGFAPPSQKRRSWKGSFARWGLAAGGIYWYTTSDLNFFAQNANEHGYIGTEILDVPQEAKLPTLEEVASSRKDRQRATLNATPSSEPPAVSIPQTTQRTAAVASTGDHSPLPENAAPPTSPESLEEEAGEQGAFNEETGEINWDCPCLGGMAHGPCGEQFRDAFSCFVYSKEEPKGVDCIDRFKTMQNCFREHPDIYGAELTDDGDDETASTPLDTPAPESQTAAANSSAADNSMASSPPAVPKNSAARTPSSAAVTSESAVPEAASGKSSNAASVDNEVKAKSAPAAQKQSTQTLTSEKERSESESLIPRAAFDSTTLNTEK